MYVCMYACMHLTKDCLEGKEYAADLIQRNAVDW